jgi:group I intron endonuclease
MYYLIYKITNTLNGKIYIGSHKTKKIDDGYMGSGRYLNSSINKYGLNNFSKEILFVFDNAKDMYAKEAEIVNEDFLAEENTYNLKKGGFGGFDYINNAGINNKTNQCSKAGKVAAANGGGFKGKRHSDNTRKLMSEKRWGPLNPNYGKPGTFTGKVHTDETKHLMSIVKKGKGIGEQNSQFGTMWITNGVENLKIRKEELDKYLERGYNKGRKIKL